MTYTVQELTPALIQSQTQDYFATLANLSTVDTMTAEDAATTLALINQQ
jgi:hypothetical protein